MLYEHRLNTSSTKTTAKKVNVAFGPGTSSDRTVHFWYKFLDEGDIMCEKQIRYGRPNTFDEDALHGELELHTDSNTRDLENALRQLRTTIDSHLNSMGYRKVIS
ncbi:Histone-lysine N-methyltransferase SETMAR [Dufourea novaeangliae]|uniref:Histone-lysine N-methyltransferase SETMAR n=1 Tax=Dufourea novaeangliae TaxID=178035 RepID=A0A154P5Y8_DUFNO|nr:Histone-lysine N-methyltransferase SETMAR [Dufourea novaeangliae]